MVNKNHPECVAHSTPQWENQESERGKIMNTQAIDKPIDVDILHRAIERACSRVAPTWPLDQSIAVNPWWNWRDTHIAELSAKLKTIGNVDMLMPKSYYLNALDTQLKPHHVINAKDDLGSDASIEDLLNFLYQDDPDHPLQWKHMGELIDLDPSRSHKMPWHDEIVHQISQFCALYFEYPEQMKQNGTVENALYDSWRQVVMKDKGISILMDEPLFNSQFITL